MDNLENVPLFSMMPNISSVLDEEALLKIKSGTADRSDLIESVMQTTPLKQIGKGISMERPHRSALQWTACPDSHVFAFAWH